MRENPTKCDCGKPVEHIRLTQFAGNHYYCEGCARKEKDFGKESASDFFWETAEEYRKAQKAQEDKAKREALERDEKRIALDRDEAALYSIYGISKEQYQELSANLDRIHRQRRALMNY